MGYNKAVLEERRRSIILEEEKKRRALSLAAIVVFACIVRLFFLFSYLKDSPFSRVLLLDSLRYDGWARAIMEGKLFEPGAFYQAPLYPYIISSLYSLFGSSLVVVYVAQMLIGILSVLLVYFVARKYFSEAAALLSSFLFALYPSAIFFESKILPETLSIFVALVLLFIMARCNGTNLFFALLAGVVLGLLTLLRPNMLLLFPLFFFWILFSKRDVNDPSGKQVVVKRKLKILPAVIFCAGMFAVIFPVTIRNFRVSGEFVLISLNGGVTFCQANNPYAKGVFTPLPGFSGDIMQQRLEERYYAQAQEKKNLSDPEVSRFWFRKGLEFIRENPLGALILEGKKFFYFFDNYEHSLEYSFEIEKKYTRNIAFLPFGILIAFAILGLIGTYPWRGKLPLVFYLGVQFLTVMIFYMSSRYRLPAVPVYAMFAGAGLTAFMEMLKRKSFQKIVVSAVLLAGFAAFSFMKTGDVYRYEEASAYGNLGTAFTSLGMTDDAISAFKKQYELDPESAFAMFNIGVVLANAGRDGEAVEYYEKAIQINPNLAEAYNNLGVIFVRWGQCEDAEALFLKAIELKPFFGNPYNNLATCAFSKGDLEKAAAIVKWADERRVSISEELKAEIRKGDQKRSEEK